VQALPARLEKMSAFSYFGKKQTVGGAFLGARLEKMSAFLDFGQKQTVGGELMVFLLNLTSCCHI